MKKIKENFYYIQNNRMENNSFILINKNFCYIVDPSWNKEELIHFINSNKLILKGMIFTHLHWDHVGDATKILNELNCNNVYVSKNGIKIMQEVANRLFIYDKTLKNFNINYVDENFNIDNNFIKFILTPGHSACSMCVIYEDSIMTGDHIFIEDIGRVDLDYSNKNDMIESIKKFKNYVVNNNIIDIYPGHGEFGKIKEILLRNKYL